LSILSPDNLPTLRPHLLKGDLTIEEIAFFVSKLKENFTTNRKSIGDYQKSIELVSSYTAFYLPSNFKKSVKTFEFLLPKIRNLNPEEIELFDIGCGPGTMSLAYSSELIKLFPEIKIIVNLVDSSLLMLEQAKKLFAAFLPTVQVFSYGPNEFLKSSDESGFELKISLFGNSVNEFGEKLFFEYLNKTSPKFICLLSPGNKDRFPKLLGIKSILESKKGFKIVYPCISPYAKCPVAENDWCHQVLRVKNDPEFERVSQKAKINRRNLAYIFHLYERSLPILSNEQNDLENKEGTILQFLGKNKACYRWRVCFLEDDSDRLKIFNAELPLRGLSKAELKSIDKLQVGDRFTFKIKKFVNESTIRIVIFMISIQN
jgi:hypothetical protein